MVIVMVTVMVSRSEYQPPYLSKTENTNFRIINHEETLTMDTTNLLTDTLYLYRTAILKRSLR